MNVVVYSFQMREKRRRQRLRNLLYHTQALPHSTAYATPQQQGPHNNSGVPEATGYFSIVPQYRRLPSIFQYFPCRAQQFNSILFTEIFPRRISTRLVVCHSKDSIRLSAREFSF